MLILGQDIHELVCTNNTYMHIHTFLRDKSQHSTMQSDESIILNVAFDSLCHDFLKADDFLFIFKCTT